MHDLHATAITCYCTARSFAEPSHGDKAWYSLSFTISAVAVAVNLTSYLLGFRKLYKLLLPLTRWKSLCRVSYVVSTMSADARSWGDRALFAPRDALMWSAPTSYTKTFSAPAQSGCWIFRVQELTHSATLQQKEAFMQT